MNSYIRNKRKIEKLNSLLNLCFWIVNFVFIEISMNMFLKLILAGKSNWFEEAANGEVSNDPFFLERTDFVMSSMLVVMILVIIFSVSTVILIRNIQLKNMYTQIGVYVVVGYSKRDIFTLCILEPLSDMLIAFPVSILVSYFVWKGLLTEDTVESIVKMLNSNIIWDIVTYIVTMICVVAIVLGHTWMFICKSSKKGIRYMLGKGVK